MIFLSPDQGRVTGGGLNARKIARSYVSRISAEE